MDDRMILQAIWDRLGPTISYAVEIALMAENDAPRDEIKKAVIKHFGGEVGPDLYAHPERYEITDAETVRKAMRGIQVELEAQQLDLQNGDRNAPVHTRRINNTLKPIKDLFSRKAKPISIKPTQDQINHARDKYIGDIQAYAQNHATEKWKFRNEMYVLMAELFSKHIPTRFVLAAIDGVVASNAAKDSAVVAFTYFHQIRRTVMRLWANGGYPRFEIATYIDPATPVTQGSAVARETS